VIPRTLLALALAALAAGAVDLTLGSAAATIAAAME
jgi:hypothetical protein